MTQEDNFIKRKEKIINAAERSTLLTLLGGIVFGLIGLIGYPLTFASAGTLMYIGILIAGAALVTGFFTGTLFGIPKRNNNGTTDYALNNSLVEIADWLTKIIVGLGLVNLKQVPAYLLQMGDYVDAAADVEGKSASVFTMCIVIYFSMLGLYTGYNYMRLVLSAKYKDADDNLMAKALEKAMQRVEMQNDEIIKQKNEVENYKSTSESLRNIVNQPSKPITEIKDVASGNGNDNVDFVDDMIKLTELKMKEGMIRNKNIDDPQKGMWGGKNEVNNRRLTALVNEKFNGLYSLHITVESTDPLNPIDDKDVVLIALHNTWVPPYYLLNIKNGKAEIELLAYGSFTIGAYCDKGTTELELDLAELPGVSTEFKHK